MKFKDLEVGQIFKLPTAPNKMSLFEKVGSSEYGPLGWSEFNFIEQTAEVIPAGESDLEEKT